MVFRLIVQGPGLAQPGTLSQLTQQVGRPADRWLAVNVALWEHVILAESQRDLLRVWCREQKLDCALLPPETAWHSYRLLAMDMDSTLISIECIDEIADAVGVKPQVAAITEAAMRGEITDFAESLRRRVALLAGVPEAALHEVYEQRLRLNPGAEVLLATARKAGMKTLLVSGGFTFFTERLRQRLRLDAAFANTLEIKDGKLTGKVLGDILDADGKAQRLLELCKRHEISPREAIAIGDGANDLRMLNQAGLSVAYHAKPAVRAATGHAIDYGGLDSLLHWFTVHPQTAD